MINSFHRTSRFLVFLPFTVLLASLAIKLFIANTPPFYYNYDEAIITTISHQPLGELLDTITSEPHPPGFYLFLKLLPVNNIPITHSLLILINSTLIVGVLLFALHQKIFTSPWIGIGVSLLLSSFTFATTSSLAKQDLITFPAILFFSLILISSSRLKFDTKKLLILHLVSVLTLFFGYIPYLFTLSCLILITYFTKPRRKSSILMFLHLIILLSYLCFFGSTQILHNLNRFNWINFQPNSFFTLINQHLSGVNIATPLVDFLTGLFVFFVFYYLYSLATTHTKLIKSNLNLIVALAIISISAVYISRFLILARYSIFIIVLLTFAAAISIHKLIPNKLIPILLIFFFLNSHGEFYNQTLSINQSYQHLSALLNQNNNSSPSGLLTDHSLSAFVLKFQIKLPPNILPVSLSLPQAPLTSPTITKYHLAGESQSITQSLEALQRISSKFNLHEYYYLMDKGISSSFFDPKKQVLAVLLSSCSQSQVLEAGQLSILFHFAHCDFNSHSLNPQ
jgi:hypothetical protein